MLLPGDNIDSINIIKQASDMGLDVVFRGIRTGAVMNFSDLADGVATDANTAFVNFYAADEAVNEEAEKSSKLITKIWR